MLWLNQACQLAVITTLVCFVMMPFTRHAPVQRISQALAQAEQPHCGAARLWTDVSHRCTDNQQ